MDMLLQRWLCVYCYCRGAVFWPHSFDPSSSYCADWFIISYHCKLFYDYLYLSKQEADKNAKWIIANWDSLYGWNCFMKILMKRKCYHVKLLATRGYWSPKNWLSSSKFIIAHRRIFLRKIKYFKTIYLAPLGTALLISFYIKMLRRS